MLNEGLYIDYQRHGDKMLGNVSSGWAGLPSSLKQGSPSSVFTHSGSELCKDPSAKQAARLETTSQKWPADAGPAKTLIASGL